MDKYLSVRELEEAALAALPRNARDYYRSGATDEQSLGENRLAFKRLRIRPRCLVGVARWDLTASALGSRVAMPVGVAATAMQRMAHPDGELANARAAERCGTVFTLSTLSTSSIEEVAAAAPDAVKWFQLYIYKDREVTRQLVLRAERAGFKAIALTVDTPLFGLRRADVRNKFSLPPHLSENEAVVETTDPCPTCPPLEVEHHLEIHIGLANFEGELANKICSAEAGSGLNEYVASLFDTALTWEDVKWLKSITKLPIVAKGVMRADDAVKALEAGCAGIIVSNHGARQVDGVAATIEALPEIVEAVRHYNAEVFLDGGVTEGTDVFKALSLGAKMVFVGRPALWGLAVGGQAGVEAALDILRTELQYAMQISGTPTVADITRDLVVHQAAYSRL